MKNQDSIFRLYFILRKYFSKKQKLTAIYSIIFGFLSSLAELISIGSIIPFVMLITSPEKIYKSDLYKLVLSDKVFLPDQLILFSFIFFLCFVCLSTVLKIVSLKLNCLVSFNVNESFSDILFKKVLSYDYKTFQKLNIKDITTTISLRSQSIGDLNYFIILMIGSSITATILLINIIFFISIKILFSLFILLLLYLFFWGIIRKRVKQNSKIFSENYEKLNKNITEMMQSYTDLVLYNLNNYFTLDFQKNNSTLRRSQGQIVFLGGFPLIIIQAIVIISLIFLVYFWNEYWDLKNEIPFFVLLVLTLQRLIPNLQSIFMHYTNISFLKDNLKKTIELLNVSGNPRKIVDNSFSDQNFEKIIIENLKYNYSVDKKQLFKKINFEICKGDKIALMGESGSGKSTLVKIILGFLEPTEGNVLINNKKLDGKMIEWWHSKAAYIPQKVFILDEDIYENIALKKDITDEDKNSINQILRDLNLLDLLPITTDLKDKVMGGEEGKEFSGGQIQRIAIARAIYQKRNFIILDETLNALDNENIVNVLDFLKKIPSVTILLIAHSDNVAKKCKKIFKIENKQINEIKIS